MFVNCAENDILFAKTVPVSVIDVFTNQTRNTQLFLTMEWKDISDGKFRKKVLLMSLTDNDDPFFLYNLHLSEDDFDGMKIGQKIKVNYASFPTHLIEHIEQCFTEDKIQEGDKNNLPFRLELQFIISEKLGNVASPSLLNIVQHTAVVECTLFSFKFVAATESAVRQYLVSCFRTIKEENRRLQNKLAGAEQDLRDKCSAYRHNLGDKDQEMEFLRNDFKNQLTMRDNKYASELQDERNRLINKHKEETNRMEKERREKEHSFRKQIQQLQAEVSKLEALNKELKVKNDQHGTTIKELRSTVFSLQDTNRRLDETNENLRKRCDNFDSVLREKESEIYELNRIIRDKDTNLRDKSRCVRQLEEQVQNKEKQTRQVQIDLDHISSQLEKCEKTCKRLEDDKMDLNRVIARLQDKVKEGRAEGELARKYKEKVEENKKLLVDAKKETTELNMNLKLKNAEISSLTKSVEGLEKQVQELENAIKSKEGIIKWFNRKLTDVGIVPHYEVNLVQSPSNVAQKELANISCARRSPGSDTSPLAVTAANNAARRTVSSPSEFNKTNATDSAYCTLPSNQATPHDLQNGPNMRFDDIDCEIDPCALSAAFGDQNPPVRHSTAKKTTKTVKSGIPKTSKKR